MELKEKAKVLEQEINLIEDIELKTLAIDLLNRIPEYFYEIAASASGKYHPQYALGEGGLVRHTKAAIMIANSLLSLEMYSHIKQDRDYIIIALLIHDAFKRGLEYSDVTVNNHAALCAEWIMNNVSAGISDNIAQLVLTHMGQWNMNGDIEVAPKPQTDTQKFVHLCDYLASRKYLEVNFGDING